MLVELILAPIMLMVHVVEILVQAVVLGIDYLWFDAPRTGERRLSFRRLGWSCVPLVLVAVFVAGSMWFVDWREARNRERTDATRHALEGCVASWDPQRQGEEVLDAWGSPIRVMQEEGLLHRKVEARSAGMDGQFGTSDDVVAVKREWRVKFRKRSSE